MRNARSPSDEIKKWQASLAFNIDPADTGKEYNVGMWWDAVLDTHIRDNQRPRQAQRLVQIAFSKYTNSPEMAPKPKRYTGPIEIDIVRKNGYKDKVHVP